MTTETRDLAWFTDRLERSTTDGRPDFYTCPVCGGGSLHVYEKLGIVVVKCFGCDAKSFAVASALEGEGVGPTISFGRKAKAASVAQAIPEGTPASPLDWWADHCGVPRPFLDYLPLSEHGDELVFAFDGITTTKRRKRGTKDFRWEPEKSAMPPLWPLPARALPPAMVLTEGEGDATVMAYHVVESALEGLVAVHSVTNPSTAVPSGAWRDLRARGLETVLVLFDDDGKKDSMAEANIASAVAAGLHARRVHVEGIDLVVGEKDARDVWLRKIALDPESTVEVNLDEATIADIGARVLTDVDGDPAPDLVEGVIDPEGLTILYGQGDSGKGVITSSLIAALTREGHRVLVADFEGHPREWRRRVTAHGGDASMVAIAEPNGSAWRGSRGALWDVVDELADIVADFGAEFVVIDSVTTAAVGAKDPYSSDTPVKFAVACQRIGRPVLALAHVTKTDDLTYPFGSIHWHTQARTTWSLVEASGRRVLEHRKRGNRPWLGKFGVDIEFKDAEGVITTTTARMDGEGPTVTLKGPEARIEAFAKLALAHAPEDEAGATSRTAIAKAMGSGNKGEKLQGVALAIERDDLVLTSDGLVYRSATGSQVHAGSQPVHEPVPDRDTGAMAPEGHGPVHGVHRPRNREP